MIKTRPTKLKHGIKVARETESDQRYLRFVRKKMKSTSICGEINGSASLAKSENNPRNVAEPNMLWLFSVNLTNIVLCF